MVRMMVFAEYNCNTYETDKWNNAEECCKYFDNMAINNLPLYFKDARSGNMVYLNPVLIREVTFTDVRGDEDD